MNPTKPILLFALALATNAGLNAQTTAMNYKTLNIKTMENQPASFEFKPLPYAYDALEPYIDKLTMEIHYSRHHRAYYDNFMKAIAGTEMEKMSLTDIFRNMSKYPAVVRNNGGGYYNHTLYWENMTPGGSAMSEDFRQVLIKNFGSTDKLKEDFTAAALSRFGSGWAWLCVNGSDGKLFITSTPNQDNPLMDVAEKQGIPVLGIDVWEHAYYLKYQNKRADYIAAFWNVIDWKTVEARFKQANP